MSYSTDLTDGPVPSPQPGGAQDVAHVAEVIELYRCHRMRNIGKLLHMAFREYSVFIEQRLAVLGHTGFKLKLMGIIGNLDAEGNTIVELADRVRYTKQAAGKIVAELEELGYVATRPHPGDKRAQLVRFTDRGLALIQDLTANVGLVRKEFTQSLAADEVQTLISLLERVVMSNMPLLENGGPVEMPGT